MNPNYFDVFHRVITVVRTLTHVWSVDCDPAVFDDYMGSAMNLSISIGPQHGLQMWLDESVVCGAASPAERPEPIL